MPCACVVMPRRSAIDPAPAAAEVRATHPGAQDACGDGKWEEDGGRWAMAKARVGSPACELRWWLPW